MPDIVALILAVGTVIMLLSGTYVRCIWLDCTQPQPLFNEQSGEFWTHTMATILGALAGYISGRDTK